MSTKQQSSSPRQTAEFCTEKEEEETTEDWNHLHCWTQQDGLTGYASYQQTSLHLCSPSLAHCLPDHTLLLDCVDLLTPIDILNLYNGIEDATGNKIWMGALLFIEAFCCAHTLRSTRDVTHLEWLQDMRSRLFDRTRVLELGCGTGASGLALLKQKRLGSLNRFHEDVAEQRIVCPSFVTLTDSDSNAIKLCERNCLLNFGESTADTERNYSICRLEWGKTLDQNSGDSSPLQPLSYDTVCATDVVYDIDALQPLFQTAYRLLKQKGGGYFVLSHVPRAAVDGALVGSASVLENVICEEAVKAGFNGRDPYTTVRPSDLRAIFGRDGACNGVSFTDMEESGAAILVFQKEGSY